jgi:hypothetical protein
LFWQCGIFCFSICCWYCSDSVVFFVFLFVVGTVLTVWYFLFFYLLLVLFWQCGIFCFSICCWYCSDSVVFFVFLFIVGTVLTVWYFLFFYLLLVVLRQNKKYHTVRTLPTTNRKTKNTTLSEHYQQ